MTAMRHDGWRMHDSSVSGMDMVLFLDTFTFHCLAIGVTITIIATYRLLSIQSNFFLLGITFTLGFYNLLMGLH